MEASSANDSAHFQQSGLRISVRTDAERAEAAGVSVSSPALAAQPAESITTGRYGIQKSCCTPYFYDKDVELASRYQLFLVNMRFQVVVLLGLIVGHTLLLIREILRTSTESTLAHYIIAFVIYDGAQFIFIALLFWKIISVVRTETEGIWGALASLLPLFRCGGEGQPSKHTDDVIQADARDIQVPSCIRSGGYEVLTALVVYLAACRIGFVNAVVCSQVGHSGEEGQIAAKYPACDSFVFGSFPFAPVGTALLAGGVFSSSFAVREAFVYLLPAAAFATTFAIACGVSYSAADRTTPPEVDDTVGLALLFILAFMLHVRVGISRLRTWRHNRATAMATRDMHRNQQATLRKLSAAEAARLKWKSRVQLAVEMSYETLGAYAAHELRNPLHVLLGTLRLHRETVATAKQLNSVHPEQVDNLLDSMLEDCDSMRSRSLVMERIILDITDFWQLRGGTLALWPTLTNISDIALAAQEGAQADGTLAPTLLDVNVPPVVQTDERRLKQLVMDTLSHAASGSPEELQNYFFAIDMHRIWPEEERTHGRSQSGSSERVHGITSSNATRSASSQMLRASHTTPHSTQYCKCDLEARMLGSESRTCISKSWLCLVVRTVGAHTNASFEALTLDPVQSMLETMSSHRRLQSPITPQTGSLSLNINTRVHASNLCLPVATMLARRLGGDMLVFEDDQGLAMLEETKCLSESRNQTSNPIRYYATLLPLIDESDDSTSSTDGGVPMCGVFSLRCPHCDREAKDADSFQAATLLFGASGRIPSVISSRLKRLITARTREMYASAAAAEPLHTNVIAVVAQRHIRGDSSGTRLSRLSSPVYSTQGASSNNTEASPTKNLHVLYVDDEASNRLLMGRFLRRLGQTYVMLSDGAYVGSELVRSGMARQQDVIAAGLTCEEGGVREAASAGQQDQPFDVIMLDIVMPLKDGASVCRCLRAIGDPKWKSHPIIAATGNAPHEGPLLEAGFTRVLPKPFSIKGLRQVLSDATR